MKKIVCLALPALIAVGCGSDAGSQLDAPLADAGRDVSPDGPAPDVYVMPDTPVVPDLPPDAPVIDTRPPLTPDAPADAPPATHDAPVIDGPPAIVDATVRGDHQDPDVPPVQPIDGPQADTGIVDARTVTFPDGRVMTVVEMCQLGSTPSDPACPVTYAEGLARAKTADASILTMTAAGRCSEGSYVYSPYLSTSSRMCYYDASTQQLIGTVNASDVLMPCRATDTVSRLFVDGTLPPCTRISWEVYNRG